jgi:hypothetical protein
MDLTFVNPMLLAGAAAAAVPIVLHLIMRQTPRLLEFPALRFVKQRQEANRRKLRLRHLILLLLRAGALCLLAAALARPSIKAPGTFGNQEAPVAAAFVFDTSPRMQYRERNQTRIEAAQEMSLWLLGQFPEDSQAAVLESRLGSAVFQVDVGSARQRIERLEPTPLPQPLVNVLTEAARLLETSELENKEIYVFSDLSQPAWSAELAGKLQEALKKLGGVGIHVIDVGVEDPSNFSLGEVRLSSQVLSKNSTLMVEADVRRRGPEADCVVELVRLVDTVDEKGQPVRRADPEGRRPVKLASGGSQRVGIEVGGWQTGTHQGYLRILQEDGLAMDNVRYFTVEVKPPWRVLVAAPSPAEENAFFFTEAIAPEDFRKAQQARFEPQVIALEELPQKLLEPYTAVCLLDPTPLPPEVWRRLRDFAAQGGGVAIFLGHNAVPVDSFNAADAQEVLPGTLLIGARAAGELYLGPEGYDHPLLTKFRPLAGEIPWDAFPVYRYWNLEALNEGVNVVIPFTNNRPALLERPVGRGRMLTMTTPVSDSASSEARWNELPTGFEPWPFVMLATESMLYLVGSTDGQLNYYAGQTALLQLEATDKLASYLLTLPPKGLALGGTGEPRADDQLRRTVDTKLNAIIEGSTDRIGNYRVRAGGDEGRLDRGFSVNLPPEASNLDRIDPKEHLKTVFGDFEYRLARSRDEIDRDIAMSRVGREIFPWLIVMVAVFLGLEHILANRFYREKNGER